MKRAYCSWLNENKKSSYIQHNYFILLMHESCLNFLFNCDTQSLHNLPPRTYIYIYIYVCVCVCVFVCVCTLTYIHTYTQTQSSQVSVYMIVNRAVSLQTECRTNSKHSYKKYSSWSQRQEIITEFLGGLKFRNCPPETKLEHLTLLE